jgi:hypothetical protein
MLSKKFIKKRKNILNLKTKRLLKTQGEKEGVILYRMAEWMQE